jgi:hypothetical protein
MAVPIEVHKLKARHDAPFGINLTGAAYLLARDYLKEPPE